MTDIPIGVDGTDHMAFFCPVCKHQSGVDDIMAITKVETKKVKGGRWKDEKCTWIHLQCGTCESIGHRKIYWIDSDFKCVSRTDK